MKIGRNIIFLINLVFLLIFICVASEKQRTYKAAVLEYVPKLTAERPLDQFAENIKEYKEYAQKASKEKVDIIVFPEDGLSGWGIIFNKTTVDELSTEVPYPSENIAPCDDQNPNYSQGLVDLSCIARRYGIYVVVNLVERRQSINQQKRIYYNTNVVFDRSGTVIARYRKINLCNEDVFEPGNETVTFKSDFGVTFGVETCFDIMFKNPRLEFLKDPAVTDITFPVAWFSELPFLQALSVHHGYAATTGVNLLSANMHDSTTANGGSAIYLAGGRIAESYMSGTNNSKMIIYDIPIINERSSLNSVQVLKPVRTQTDELNINAFHTYQEDMSNYTLKTLDLNKEHSSETVCNGDTNFCCSFDISLRKNHDSEPNYVYKLAVFHGSRTLCGKSAIGIRNCGIVACLNSSDESCGGRHKQPPKGITFESISVKGTFNAEDSHDQPSTLSYNLIPLSGYTFNVKRIGIKNEVVIRTTEVQKSVLTFGIHGRVFSNDNKPAGTIAAEI